MLRKLLLAALLSCTSVAGTAAAPQVHAYKEYDPPGQPAANGAIELRVKQLVDRYRADVGLPPVRLDEKLSQGCMQHAEYMRLNKNSDAIAGLNAHHERRWLRGASAEGAACGEAADLFFDVSDLAVAVDGWMAVLYHRRPILSPALERIGVGYAKLPDGSYMAALMFADSKTGGPRAKWPIAYPANNQRGIPLEFGGEVPNPVPGGGRAGYPITIEFPPFDKLTGARATLTDGKGRDVPFYLSDPEHPATSFGQYGVVCLIPKLPLLPNSRYAVQVDAMWNGKPRTWHWNFTTLGLRTVDAGSEEAVTRSINVASTLRGTVIHGGMMEEGSTAYLQIGLREPKRYKMVFVLIPRRVWSELGGTPDRFIGRTIEVDGTPQLMDGAYVDIPITVGGQLRMVR